MGPAKPAGREAAVAIIQVLREAGHVAHLAGGCVRDALLGLEPTDYDVATDAPPERVRALLPRSRYVGEAFGVVLVRQYGVSVEVATFRAESGYEDGRRPSHITFTDAEHDAKRRDFTINGLFADPLPDHHTPASRAVPGPGSDSDSDSGGAGDRIIDYVGGQVDLAARVIRAIGDPNERFAEDYLRMLRAPRFAARLGFYIEPATAAAILPLAPRLSRISRERIGQEIAAMLTGPNPATAAALVQDLHLDAAVFHEDHLDKPLPTLTAARHGYFSRHDSASTLPLMLTAWMIDRHAHSRDLPAVARFCAAGAVTVLRRWRKALCLSNQVRDEVAGILRITVRAADWKKMDVAPRKRLLASPHWPGALHLLKCLDAAEEVARIETDAAPLHADGVAPPPMVTGDDLIRLGGVPGPRFAGWLHEVYDAQLAGEIQTREEALAWLAEQIARAAGG